MNRSGIAAGVTALLLAGGLSWAMVTRRWPPAPGLAERRAEAPAPAPAPGQPGWQRRHALAFEARIGRTGQGGAGGEGRRVRLEGEWVVTVAAGRNGETDLACEVVGPRLTGGEGSPDVDEALRRRLARVFWVTARPDGALVRVHFPRDLDPADRNLLQMLATEAQVVVPAEAGPAWTAVERDGAGLYLAAYRREGDGRVAKRKVRYLEADGAAGQGQGVVEVEVVADDRHLELDGRGALRTLDASSRLVLGAAGPGGERLGVEVTLHLSGGRDGSAPDLAGSLARAGSAVESSAIRTHGTDPAEARARRDRGLVEGRSARSILDEAGAAGSQARAPGMPAGGADPALLERLAALFRLQPATIPEAAAQARLPGGPRVIAAALGTAGTPQAVEALGGLLRDPAAPEEARLAAASGLARVRQPEADAVRLPLDLLDEPSTPVRRAAALAAGALARAGRGSHPAEAAAVESQLAARYAAADDTEERLAMLGALGNAAGPVATEVLGRALGDPRADVRAAAARGLRLAAGSRVDRLLAGVLSSDGDPSVRLAAIFAAGFREVDPFIDVLCVSAAGDPAEQVRRAAVGLLRRSLDASPAVRRALEKVASGDPAEGVRRVAREALGGPGR